MSEKRYELFGGPGDGEEGPVRSGRISKVLYRRGAGAAVTEYRLTTPLTADVLKYVMAELLRNHEGAGEA